MIWVFVAYLLILIALAIWSRRETGTLAGFFLAGRRLPPWVVAFSANATGESGWLLLGLTGMGYAVGAQAFWVVIGEVVGIALSWGLVARRFKRLSDEAEAITVPDVLVARFGDHRHILRGLSVVVIVVMVTVYLAAQMVASGKAFGAFMNVDYTAAVLLGAAITITYSFVGGYKAVAYTDVVQGVLMLAGLVVMPVVAIRAAGGWGGVTTELGNADVALLSLTGGGGEGVATWVVIASFLAIGLPFLGVPQMMVRFMSARSEKELGRAGVISVLVILAFDVGAVLTGMAGRALVPGLEDPETIFPHLAESLFPSVITGLFMVIVVAAIMSTVDSLLLLASSTVVRDLYQKILDRREKDADLTRYGKAATIVVGLVGVVLALQESRLIFWFVLFAWSGLGATFTPAILGGLYDRRMNLAGAVAGMLGGFVTTIVWVLWFKVRVFDLYEMIPGLLVGLGMAYVVSRVTGGLASTEPKKS